MLIEKGNETGKLYSRYFLSDGSCQDKAIVAAPLFCAVLKGIGHGAVDLSLQGVFNRIIDDEVTNWEQAFKKSSKLSAVWSGVWGGFSTLLPWKRVRESEDLINAIVSGFIVVTEKAWEAADCGQDYTVVDGFKDFLGNAAVSYIGTKIFGKVVQHGAPKIINGCKHWYDNINVTTPLVKNFFRNFVKDLAWVVFKDLHNLSDNILKDAFKISFPFPNIRDDLGKLTNLADDFNFNSCGE